MSMVAISRKQAIEAATEALRNDGPDITMIDVARLLKIDRRDMYKFFRNAAEMTEAVTMHWVYGLRRIAHEAIEDLSPAEACLDELCVEIVRMQSRGILKGASDEILTEYQSVRLSTLQDILEKCRRSGVYMYADVGTAARLCLHVLDDHSRQVLAFYESTGRSGASQKGVDVDLRTADFEMCYEAVYDMLTVAIRVPSERIPPVRPRQSLAAAGAH